MQVDHLIVGQGICGTFLSYYLMKEERTVAVIDHDKSGTPTKVSAGIINPVTGRRYVTVWKVEEVLAHAKNAYKELGDFIGEEIITTKSGIDFFPGPDMLTSFTKRIDEGNPYLHSFPEQNKFNNWFNHDFGCGEIRPVYVADLYTATSKWRELLREKKALVPERFEHAQLTVTPSKINYAGITASSIIFCEGPGGADNPYFRLLPFALNKGEAVWVRIKDLPSEFIYKRGMMFVPTKETDVFWVGADYIWEFEDDKPTDAFRSSIERSLSNWLKVPFEILDHKAAVRPATVERRPFVGMHPHHPSVFILNGMGTKGSSLGPYFAKELADQIIHGRPVSAEADINRFRKLLERE